MKLPSVTWRTRSFDGSNSSVSVTVDRRDASLTESGIVYGPPPTRNAVLGVEMMTCAEPMPGDVDGVVSGVGVAGRAAGAGGVVGAAATSGIGVGAVGAGCGGVTAGAGCAAGGCTGTVPGIGDEPGGGATSVPPGARCSGGCAGTPAGAAAAGGGASAGSAGAISG